MQYHELPRPGLRISRAAFGCARLGGTVERFDKSEAVAVLNRAFDEGINFFDTADIYAQGNSEKLLGETFRGRRDQVILATKGGYVFSTAASFLSKLKPLIRKLMKLRPGLAKMAKKARGSQIRQDFSPEHLSRALDASLQRLGTDYVDLYQLHSPSAEVLGNGAVFDFLESCRKAGKIRAFGVSILDPEHGFYGMNADALQIEAHFLKPEAIHGIVPAASGKNVATLARQPFGSGLLTRAPETWTADDFGGDINRLELARARVRKISALGDPCELALRYLLHHSGFSAVLFATTRLANLEKNLRALEMPPLPESDVKQLESIIFQ
jgi:aryl-alcohol dehydrogenase-like predicted oxidoreductase